MSRIETLEQRHAKDAYKREVAQRMRELLARVGLKASVVVRKIHGWGYSKLANYLIGKHLPSPTDLRKFTIACGAKGCEHWIYYGEITSLPPPLKRPGKTRRAGRA